MLGSKRQHASGTCPDRPGLKLIKDDALSVYESTFRKMRTDQPPLMARASAEATRSCQDTNTCLCRPDSSVASVTRRETIGSNITCQGAVDLSSGTTSWKSPSMPDADGLVCFHCRRKTCAGCWRHCAQCEEDFCSVCSILDFSERYDRAFCLDCYSSIQISTTLK
eukprot:c14720_g2_i1 orf=166-663(+)